MPGHGPAPKERHIRDRNDDPDFRVIVETGAEFGPALPDGYEWHPRTAAWWETWRRSAQAPSFTDTDWSFLLDTALMHSAMWAKGQWTLAAEVRLRAAKFGATPEDRMRLKFKVEVPKPELRSEPGTVSDLDARRARLAAE